MRRHLIRFVVLSSFVNAVPAIGLFNPVVEEPIADELMGSGREAADAARQAGGSRRGPTRSRRRQQADPAVRAIRAACLEVLDREPELGARLIASLPVIRRDDTVGRMVMADGAILFNRSYVASLTRVQLYAHVWQLGLTLDGPA